MNTPLVSTDWLVEHHKDPDLVILDASMKGNVSGLTPEFPDQQISGARYLDLKGKFSDKNSPLPNTLPAPDDFEKAARELGINSDSKVVIYDNLGIYSAPRVWWMFRAMGHGKVAVLDGGLPAWIKAGHPASSSSEDQFSEGNFRSDYSEDHLKSAEAVHKNIEQNEFVTIDARSAGRFRGTAPEPRQELRSGHIPGSVNLPYKEVLDGDFFKPKVELQRLFAAINPLNKPMTFTCGSGLTACIILLAAELAGRDGNSVYDGSWTDWGSRVDLPVTLGTE